MSDKPPLVDDPAFYLDALEQVDRWLAAGDVEAARAVIRYALRGERACCPQCPKSEQETLFEGGQNE